MSQNLRISTKYSVFYVYDVSAEEYISFTLRDDRGNELKNLHIKLNDLMFMAERIKRIIDDIDDNM